MVVTEIPRHEEKTDYCYACQGTKLITDTYTCELICANCGLVVTDKDGDRQIYEDTESNSISPLSNQLCRYDMGLYTNILDSTKDANGHTLDTLTRSKMKRLKRLDSFTKTSKNGTLMDVFQDLDKLKHVLNLSAGVVEKTAYIYRKARDRDLIRGRSRPSMLAACLYIACREMQNNRSLEDILDATNLKKKDVSRDYRLLLFELEIMSPVIDPIRCVVKIANLTCISEASRRGAFKAMNRMTKLGRTAGKNPMGIAASLVYLSCSKTGESITQVDIAKAAGITEMTLRNRIRDLIQLYIINKCRLFIFENFGNRCKWFYRKSSCN
jgi:transcription initiation factor TFIIB